MSVNNSPFTLIEQLSAKDHFAKEGPSIYPHFADGSFEEQRSEGTCLGSHSKSVAELGTDF